VTEGISRRTLLKAAGLGGAAVAVPGGVAAQAAHQHMAQAAAGDPLQGNSASSSSGSNDVLFFFNDEEAQFIEAAIDRLIPPDPEWTGAAGAGVLYYIDRQLASAYGAGGRMYLNGPWVPNAPSQFGYQLRYSPAELYRVGIEQFRQHVRESSNGQEFWQLAPAAMDGFLTSLERGDVSLPSVPGPVFFETLLANTIEGFFSDPAYGGNRDMVGWRMVGFPGAYAAYLDVVDRHNMVYDRRPISFADQRARQAHLNTHR